MNKSAKLFLEGQERELLYTSVSYHRGTRFNGKPCTELQGGLITVSFISHKDDDIFVSGLLANRYDERIKIKDHREWRRNYKLTDGKIVFYKEDDIELFQYNFKDAVIVYFHEQFDNLNSMYTTMVISPAIQDYRFRRNMKWTEKSTTRFVKYAWQENYIEPTEERTIQQNTFVEEKNKEIEGFWIDIDNNPLKLENGFTKNVVFGEQVRIKLVADDKSLNKKVEVTVKALKNNKNEKLSNDDSLTFNVELKDGEGISEPFLIDMNWYNEEDETYEKSKYETIIKSDKALTFVIKTNEYNIKNTDKLIPYTYRRNYEELMGLYKYENPPQKINDTSQKDSVNNIENHFINSNNNIKSIVDTFIKEIYKENLSGLDILKLVNEYSEKLWSISVKEFQKGKLDDRPLYWARIKMQVYLKKHPIYKKDFDLEMSLISKGTALETAINNFEIFSRNYQGIKFKKNKKNILITGFDPFQLSRNPSQSNPSGLVALKFHNTILKESHIQTMIFPVRYSDFDSKTNPVLGNGTGVVEKYIGEVIDKNPNLDAIITVSQKFEGDYHFEVFATNTRGGASANMNYTRIGEKAICGEVETLPTTLPDSFENNEAIFFGEYYETKEESNNCKYYEWYVKNEGPGYLEQEVLDFDYQKTNNPNFTSRADYNDRYERNELYKKYIKSYNDYQTQKIISTKNNYPKKKIYDAPGGNYLSNEIFYRVALLREKKKTKLPTGHFHISKIQKEKEDLHSDKVEKLLEIIEEVFKTGFKGIKNI